MSTNNCFSFARLRMVMKRDFMENWKRNLYVFLGIFIAFLAVYLFNMAEYNESWTETYKEVSQYVNPHTASFAFITSFSLFYFATEMMRNMRTKENRLSYLMLPASMLEKFVSRALYVTVGTMLMVFVASLLAEAVHWVFMPFFDDIPDKFRICVWPEAWGNVWETISPVQTRMDMVGSYESYQLVEKSMFYEIQMGYMLALWSHSLFILGGNYFGKHAFLKTVVSMILLGIVLSYVASLLDIGEVWAFINQFKDFLRQISVDHVCIFLAFVFFCFTVLNWWLSYKLFTRRQVIEPKFRLL